MIYNMKEHFKLIVDIKGFKVYDVEHAVVRFKERYPNLPESALINTITKGVTKIFKKSGFGVIGNFLIVSYKYDLRIPLEIRKDKYDDTEFIGAVATVLDPTQVRNLRNEVEVMVESNQNVYQKFPLMEGFNLFADGKYISQDFETVEV